MTRSRALAAGFSALSRRRLILLLTGCSLVLGILSAAPLAPAMDDAFRDTLAGDHLIRNHPEFAPADVLDFLREKAAAVAGARQATAWAARQTFSTLAGIAMSRTPSASVSALM